MHEWVRVEQRDYLQLEVYLVKQDLLPIAVLAEGLVTMQCPLIPTVTIWH